MLNNLREQLKDPILDGRGESIKEEILKLTGNNRKQEVKRVCNSFGIDFKLIINDINNSLKTNNGLRIKQELQDNARKYGEYFEKMKNKDYLIAQEIFYLLSEYADKVIFQEEKRLSGFLLMNPGIEDISPKIKKIINLNTSESQLDKEKSSGLKILGKIELPQDPRGEAKRRNIYKNLNSDSVDGVENTDNQAENLDHFFVNGDKPTLTEFMSAFSLNYKEIEDCIKNQTAITARYSNSTISNNKRKIHFFTIGKEEKGNNSVNINVSILDRGKDFEEGKIYKVIITDMFENKNAKNNDKKQSNIVRGILKEDHRFVGVEPSSRQLSDNEVFRLFRDSL